MSIGKAALSVLAKLIGRLGTPNPDREFDGEILAHLRLLTERYIREGMKPSEADSAARRQFENTALQATKLDLLASLKDMVGTATGSSGSARFRKMLVAAQVALSFLLLMGAGLFAKTLANLKNTHTGFESAGNLVSFQVDPAKNGYTVARTRNSTPMPSARFERYQE